MNQKLKKIIIATICVVAGMAVVFFVGLKIILNNFSREISKLEVNNIDISAVEDGIYKGEYHLNEMAGAIVEIKVMNSNIEEIIIIQHNSSDIGKKAEFIINSVIDSQSLQVDAISGATGSSTIILKAIENALR